MHSRQFELTITRASDDDARVVEASISSETPVFRPGLGNEVLVHSQDAVDLSRSPLPLIVSHDQSNLPVGVVEGLRLAGKKLRGVLRFGNSTRAREVWEDVKAGILRSLSVAYEVLDYRQDGDDFIVTRWRPIEASLVSVPADPTVGVGRSYQTSGGFTMEPTTENPPVETRSQRRAANRQIEAERARVNDILAIGEQFKDYGADELAREYIQAGKSVEAFKQAVLDRVSISPLPTWDSPSIGLTTDEVERFSFIRAIRAQMDHKFATREAGFELECSRAVAQQLGREPQGLFVPSDVLHHQRDLNVGTPSAGGNMVATELLASDFITLLRNKMRIMELGATVISGVTGNLAIPRQTDTATSYWVTEGGAPTESEPAFDQVTMSPKSVAAFTEYTRKMILQSTPDIETIVRTDLATVLALEVDRAAINGSGTAPEPTGILNTIGIGIVAIGADGGAPTWDHVVQLESALADANADEGQMAYLTNSKVRGKLKRTFIDSGSGERAWDNRVPDRPLNGYRCVVSNQVPSNLSKGTGTNLSAIIFGAWQDLIIAQWSAIDLLVDPYTLSASGGIRVVAFQDVDIAVRHAESFAAIVDADTA